MQTILVTGGAGFIGANFINCIRGRYQDAQILNLDKLTYAGNLENLAPSSADPGYRFIRGDICDPETVTQIFQEYEVEGVFHFAAESHVDRSIRDSAAFVRTNVLGTHNLLEAARRAWSREDGNFCPGKRFLYVSTDEVYGSLGASDPAFREDSPYHPNNPYAASKAAGDLLVQSYIRTYGFPANITHCGNNYGPRQHSEKFLPTVIRGLLKGEEIPIYGDGENVRDWIYVEDHVNALEAVWTKGEPGETYNIGASCERRNLKMAETLIRIMKEEGLPVPEGGRLVHVEDRKAHDRRYALDTQKIRALGWRPETELEEGLKKTVEWYSRR